MNFKVFYPRWHNLVPSLLLTFLGWLFSYFTLKNSCIIIGCGTFGTSCRIFLVKLLPTCCTCYDSHIFITQLIGYIIIPFIFVYIVSSIVKLIRIKK